MKIRKPKTTFMVTAMVLSVAFLLVSCGIDTTRQEQTVPDVTEETKINENMTNESDVTDNHEVLNEKIDIYNRVLAEYSDMVQNDFYMELRDSDAYDNSFGEHIGLEIRTHKQEVYYAFYDIDGNGTMELIIAGGENSVSNPSFCPWNYDLYGYDGNKVVSLFPDMELGGRSNFSFHGDGVIEVVHSLPQREICIEIYKIGNDGVTPELVDRFYIAADLTGEKAVYTYFQNGQTGSEISEEAYRSALQGYETPLAEELVWEEIY